MSFQCGRELHHLDLRNIAARDRACSEEAAHDRGRRRTEAGSEWDGIANVHRVPGRPPTHMIKEGVHRTDNEVGLVRRERLGPLALDHNVDRVTPRFDVDLEMHAHRDTERVEAGSEVRNRGRNQHLYRTGHLIPLTSRSHASG
jgi:hypothetical protein